MLKRLARLLSPEEHRLDLDGGKAVRHYLECYRRQGPDGCAMRLADLEPAHLQMDSSLHHLADPEEVCASALLYAASRLPRCMPQVQTVALAVQPNAFADHPWGDVSAWQPVAADKRRRRAFFDGRNRLAMLVSSLSDIDDLIPSLCAYQIEWNKLHQRLARSPLGPALADGSERASSTGRELRTALGLSRPDYEALAQLWGDDWDQKMADMASSPKDLELLMLPIAQDDFEKAAERWWQRLLKLFEGLDLAERPVYMVTSNNHSLANLISGFASRHVEHLTDHGHRHLGPEWESAYQSLSAERSTALRNLLYLAQDGLLAADPDMIREKGQMEREAGVHRSGPVPPLLAETQVVELNQLIPQRLDPRLRLADPAALARSRAVILNTDYPLGFGAYHLIKCAGRYLPHWRGLFVLGKSAAMIGRLGDVMIPTQVRDVHSAHLFELPNRMNTRRLTPYVHDAAVFDDQRSLTVHGTFLHSWDTVRRLHRADFTGIEMEAGPCLAALADHFAPRLAGQRGLARLELPQDFSLGILHYTSDTPYNLRASLLSKPLGLTGLESTYSCSLAILQYILERATHSGG
ncbi:MAG: hypothetical protein K9K65_07215 [Desulfarculaceae bacterium]|nr:hypothetical protein [Desulfarculaceae bacterium]MCF8049240.1 hypothetical protein [Desulfarculaceae bacterium]MCF8097617.1 hypothetical protein [Desulfarculaceae bacterium]MCF8122385.1 hypothetical protein [Desulfarculaceae bacterium]